MPTLIYSADFREKDGEVMTASDVSDNFGDIELLANNLDWTNIQPGSLDTYHMENSTGAKGVHGQYSRKYHLYNTWVTMATIRVPVQVGDGIYAAASVTWPSREIADYLNYTNHWGKWRIRAAAEYPLGVVPNQLIGEYGPQDSSDPITSPEMSGQSGVVWAYQATAANVPESGFHSITLEVKVEIPGPPLSLTAYTISLNPLRGIMGNITVFAIRR